MLALTLTLSTSLCRGQEVKLVKRLDEHSYVITIDGKSFKAVDNELLNQQQRAFDKLNETVTALTMEKKNLIEANQLIIQQRDDAKANLQDAKGLIAQQRATIDQEVSFRHDAVQQLIPHGDVSGFGGKLLKALDSPYFQFGVKVAVPIANTFGVYMKSARCQ